MKKIVFMLALVSCLICFASCGKPESLVESTEAITSTESTENITPTGYPYGEIQMEILMFNDKLWVGFSGEIMESLPASYKEIGQVLKEDSKNMPTENYESCHIEVGTKIYAKEDSGNDYDEIVLERKDGTYLNYSVYTGK